MWKYLHVFRGDIYERSRQIPHKKYGRKERSIWLQVLIDLHALSIRADVFVSRVRYTSKIVDTAISTVDTDIGCKYRQTYPITLMAPF